MNKIVDLWWDIRFLLSDTFDISSWDGFWAALGMTSLISGIILSNVLHAALGIGVIWSIMTLTVGLSIYVTSVFLQGYPQKLHKLKRPLDTRIMKLLLRLATVEIVKIEEDTGTSYRVYVRMPLDVHLWASVLWCTKNYYHALEIGDVICHQLKTGNSTLQGTVTSGRPLIGFPNRVVNTRRVWR